SFRDPRTLSQAVWRCDGLFTSISSTRMRNGRSCGGPAPWSSRRSGLPRYPNPWRTTCRFRKLRPFDSQRLVIGYSMRWVIGLATSSRSIAMDQCPKRIPIENEHYGALERHDYEPQDTTR